MDEVGGARARERAGARSSSSRQPSETSRTMPSGLSVASTSPAWSASSRERASAARRADSARSSAATASTACAFAAPGVDPQPAQRRGRTARARPDSGAGAPASGPMPSSSRAPASAVRAPRAAAARLWLGVTLFLSASSGVWLKSREARPPPAPARRCRGCTPVPSSSPARCVSRGMDVDPPAEVVGARRRGAHPQVQRRARAEPAAQPAQHVVQQRGAERAVVLEARRGRRGAIISWNGTREAYGAIATASSSIATIRVAPADLLLHEVAEQVAAHRAGRVGGEVLALAGDRGRHEAQRVELRVRVRERGARPRGAR